ncbi:MAG: EAL domain-containing protein [Lysobacterales bacterium]|jgi:diguanylate cyclase (GGDEF)-like protein/PAS domain S-box-containing protein|nr:MAG: EAL domain-containing protein [Xanthomonadales bacterium]
MLNVALVALGLLVVLLGVLLAKRTREVRDVRDLAERLTAVAQTGDVGERLSEHSTSGSAGELAMGADRLIARLRHETEARVEREALYRRLNESMNEAVAVECDGLRIANVRFAELCGASTTSQLVGRSLVDFVSPDFAELVAEHLRRHLAGEPAPARLEAELRTAPGHVARVELAFARTTYEGQPAVLVSAVEMTPALEPSPPGRGQATAWEALDALGEGILTTDVDARIAYANKAAEELVGKPATELIGRTLIEVMQLSEEGDRRSLADPVRQCLASGGRVHLGRRGLVVTGNGEGERSIELSVAPLRDAAGELSGAVVTLRDVSELRGLTRQLSYQASHDALTGLVNVREFERRLQESLEAARTLGQRHVLCNLDLDRFKAVNDDVGHVAGDNMLREVAALIKNAVRDSDTVARVGGDEFGILLVGCPLEKARQIADDVVRAVADYRFVWKDKIFNIGVSVGLVEISRESGSLDDLKHAADSACYVAKRQGSHVHVYSARDEAAARSRGEIQWLQQLKTALKEGGFELYAQPIVSVDENEPQGPGLEVLLRLRDETGASVAAAEFMKPAERYRLMPDVDRWVVQTALAALARGAVKLPPGRSLCVNLSGQTLGDAAFLEFVVDCLDRTGVAPDRICFEVTENSVITNVEHARRFIDVLHGMGCQFALDDFGRGLSSFANLKNLSLDYLKIDGYFIRNLATDTVNQAMVTAMIKLARSLNFRVVAEHVEDVSSLESARRMGVDFVQGYQVGRPQPLATTG